jgi:hypothetical protein
MQVQIMRQRKIADERTLKKRSANGLVVESWAVGGTSATAARKNQITHPFHGPGKFGGERYLTLTSGIIPPGLLTVIIVDNPSPPYAH